MTDSQLSLFPSRTQLLTQELLDEFKAASAFERNRYLFLEPSDIFPRAWIVQSTDAPFRNRLEGVISSTDLVTLMGFKAFRERCQEQGYEIVFIDDPSDTFEWLAALDKVPEVSVASSLNNTINGMFGFQVQGFNFLKHLRGGIVNWSQGTGKTVLGSALTLYHFEQSNCDLCLWVVKDHNKINTQRALRMNIDMPATIIDGTASQRRKLYDRLPTQTLILNYEKFRSDKDELRDMLEGSRVFVVWDEMPTRVRNRGTAIYRSVCEALYRSYTTHQGRRIYYPKAGAERPAELRQVMLSATPIEHSPEDFFNEVRIIDPTVFGSVQRFYQEHVAGRDKYHRVTSWRNEDEIGNKAAHITHQVDKADPDIAAQFPKVLPPETIYLQLDPITVRLYREVQSAFRKGLIDQKDVLSAILVQQMLCNNPRGVLASAQRRAADDGGAEIAQLLRGWMNNDSLFSDKAKKGELRNPKLLALHDLLTAGTKTLVFSAFNHTNLPYISEWLSLWGVDHVTYHGSLSTGAKQEAEDRFTSDPSCQVFLSSDSGADSLNLEAANVVIHYDLPWSWATKQQRENRVHRITSGHDHVRVVTLMIADSVEERRAQIIDEKWQHHKTVLKGDIATQAMTLRIDDLLTILLG